MKIANKIFKKYGFFVVLGLFTALFVSEAKAMKRGFIASKRDEAAKQYELGQQVLKQYDISVAIMQLTSIAKASSLEDLVARINKATPGNMSFNIYKEEIIKRIGVMREAFTQILDDYEKWAVATPIWTIFSGYKIKKPPVVQFPQYSALGKLNEDISKLIKKELLIRENKGLQGDFSALRDKIRHNSLYSIDLEVDNLIELLNQIKSGVKYKMADTMLRKKYYPSQGYWLKKGMDKYNKEHSKTIIEYYLKQISAAE